MKFTNLFLIVKLRNILIIYLINSLLILQFDHYVVEKFLYIFSCFGRYLLEHNLKLFWLLQPFFSAYLSIYQNIIHENLINFRISNYLDSALSILLATNAITTHEPRYSLIYSIHLFKLWKDDSSIYVRIILQIILF